MDQIVRSAGSKNKPLTPRRRASDRAIVQPRTDLRNAGLNIAALTVGGAINELVTQYGLPAWCAPLLGAAYLAVRFAPEYIVRIRRALNEPLGLDV
jgi:hypothetical protein